jgi:hypothetical protein
MNEQTKWRIYFLYLYIYAYMNNNYFTFNQDLMAINFIDKLLKLLKNQNNFYLNSN